MPAQSATTPMAFAGPAGLPLTVDFCGGRLTSDGGLPWRAEADAALGGVPRWQRRVRSSAPGGAGTIW